MKVGETSQTEKAKVTTYLDSARDWSLEADMGKRLKIPAEITVTHLRPDALIISRKTRQMAIIELTVPSEERIEISGELKRAKYAPIIEEGREKGWRVSIWAVEVGCRGFPARSMTRLLKDMGYTGRKRKAALRKLGEKAEEASRAIWGWSNMKNWGRSA